MISAASGLWKILAGVVGVAAILLTIQTLRVSNLTLERDQAVAATTLAQRQLEAIRLVRAAEVKALEEARKEDDERRTFKYQNSQAIQSYRQSGDGDLPPVLRDTAHRLRDRYQSRAGAARNP